MPWTTPETFTAGQTLTAASMNAITDNTAWLKAITNVQQSVLTAASGPTSLAANTWTADILTVSITPTFANSKVLVRYVLYCDASIATPMLTALYRNGSLVTGIQGDAASNRPLPSGSGPNSASTGAYAMPVFFLDSPASTSAVTYSVRLRHTSALTRDYVVNRSYTDTNDVYTPRLASIILAQEVPVP